MYLYGSIDLCEKEEFTNKARHDVPCLLVRVGGWSEGKMKQCLADNLNFYPRFECLCCIHGRIKTIPKRNGKRVPT